MTILIEKQYQKYAILSCLVWHSFWNRYIKWQSMTSLGENENNNNTCFPYV